MTPHNSHMNIKNISQLVTAVLIIFIISFAVTVSWSLNHLHKAFVTVEFFGQQKVEIDNKIYQPVLSYLHNGQANLLTELTNNLALVQDNIQSNANFSSDAKQSLLALLAEIQQSTLPELAAAGKLAEPQVLLINNEQIAAQLRVLLNYVDKASHAAETDRYRYFLTIGKAQSALLSLARLRQNYFLSDKPQAADSINEDVKQLSEYVTLLSHYPLLGVEKSQNNQDAIFTLGNAASSEKSEDMAVQPIAELSSLLAHYAKDLETALNFVKQKQNSQNNIHQQMTAFKDKLMLLEADINQDYLYYENLMYTIMVAYVILLVILTSSLIIIKGYLTVLMTNIIVYLDKLAHGDLSAAFSLQTRVSELNQLKTSLEKLHNYFKILIQNINQETANLQVFGDRIETVAQDLNSIIADQQQATELAVTQMHDLTLSFKQVADNATESQNSTTAVQQLIEQGTQQINNTNQQVNNLEQVINNTADALLLLQADATAIEGVLSLIQGFAEQTNLLALNAAIEAARAGEHGRGFAVVADEVRNLSGNTAQAASQIQALVEKLNLAVNKTAELMASQQKVANQTTQAVAQTNQAFEGIKIAILRIYQKSSEIAIATNQQLKATENFASNYSYTVNLTKKTAAAAQSNQVSASALSAVCNNLHQLVVQFKLN